MKTLRGNPRAVKATSPITVHNEPTPVDPLVGPVELFRGLVVASARRDFVSATKFRRMLHRHGWSVAPCSKSGEVR